MRLSFSLRISLALTLILLVGITNPAFAAPGDETTVGELELTSTFECISVYSNFSGDDNENNFASFQWREAGGSWKQGMALTVDRRATVRSEDGTYTNDFQNQWRGSILGLTPNSEYEVRVTFSDPDGITGTNPITSTVTTRNDNFQLGSGNTYYVAKDGDDGNDGSESYPWLTIQKAADSVGVGDTVYIKAGTYTETVNISTSGAAGNLITFLNYGDDTVTIDGEGIRSHMSIGNGVHHLRIKGLRFIDASGVSMTIGNNCWDIVIEENYWRGLDDSAIRLGTIWDSGTNIGNITLQDNEIHVTNSTTGGPHIISFQNCDGGGHVVRNNSIIDSTNNFPPPTYIDGIGGYNGGIPEGFVHKDSDIYDNYIEGVIDDAIEADGGNVNVRIWGNTIRHSFIGISADACITGPLYVFRNVVDIQGDGRYGFNKLGHESAGTQYWYHNTFYVSGATNDNGFTQMNPGLDNVISRNNIICATRYVIEFNDGNGHGHDFDYDCLTSTDPSRFVYWGSASYQSLSSFQSSANQELHGIEADPLCVDPGNGDLHLQSDSPCIDAGVIIQGFNDANSPWPYSGSAPDIGAYEFAIAIDETDPPYTSGWVPDKDEEDVYPNTDIVVHVQDDGAGVDQSTIAMTVEGIDVTGDLVITGSPSDYTLTYDPPVDFSPSQEVNVTVDAWDSAATPNRLPQDINSIYSFTITTDFGDAPEFTSPIGDQTTAENELLTFTVIATDTDGPLPLEYTASNLPSGASFNTGTQEFSWTPNYNQANTYPGVHFEVTDGLNTVSEDITITVTNVNRQPTADAGPDQQVSTGNQVTLDGTGSSDPDGDPITYLWTQTGGVNVTLSDDTSATPAFTPAQNDTYVFSLVVTDNGTLDSNPDSVTIAATQWPYLPLRVNCAGEDYTDGSSNLWQADQAYTSGYWGLEGGNTVDRGNIEISGTTDDRIYQTERYSLSSYLFDLGNGVYDINLHFAETYHSGAGQRVFDVYAEGQLVLDNLDIYSEVGGNAALIKTINNVAVNDGQLNITFDSVVEEAEINGIEIFAAGVNSPPVLNPIGDKSVNEGELLEFTVSASDPDNDILIYSAIGLPLGATLSLGTGEFSWTPTYDQADVYTDVQFRVSDNEFMDTESITITVNNATPPPPPDDGGDTGGGGGGGGGGSAGFTNVYDTVTSSGRFLSEVNAKSDDGNVILYIPKDTIGLNRYGYPLISIGIKEKLPAPSPPEHVEIIGLVYEITPSGSTLSPPATLTIKYSENEIPMGVAEKNLVIASYDLQSKQWRNLGCAVDIENNTVTTHMDIFSIYSVLAYTRPASFQVTDFSVNPVEASVGEEVSISLVITNTGDLAGSHEVSLELDNTVIQNREVTLAGGDSELMTVSTVFDTAGVHQLVVGNSLATFNVEVHEAAATFTASALDITPAEVYRGGSVSIDVLVTNDGSLPGSYDVVLKIDGEMIETREVILDGGDSEMVTFNFIPDSSGQFAINVNGLIGLCEVEEPPAPPVVEEVSGPSAEVSSFVVTPIYDPETGKLVSVTINYQINDAGLLSPESALILRVLYEGELLEEIPLLSVGEVQPDGNTGSLGYISSLGWRPGLYTFQAELYEGESIIHSPEQRQFTVTPESITTAVSWRTMGVIIGSMVVIIMIVVAFVLYRRRDMFTSYIDDYTR